MSQFVFDEALVQRLETLYRKRDVLRRRRLVREALAAEAGEHVLDVGCGPGFYLAEMLEAVGPGGEVVGVDASPESLAAAARRCGGEPNVTLLEGDATALPVADASADAALSVQVLEYVPDVPAALAELRRAVRPGGRVVLWDVDWSTVSWHSERPDRMARVLRAWDAHLAHPALPRTLASQLRAAGFGDVRAEGHVFATAELDPEAFGAGVVLPTVEFFVARRAEIGEQEAAAWAAEQQALHERGAFFFACVQFCFTATRG